MNFDGFISYSHAADGRLAPAVQRGLHRLAKPWHRRRALWIFRDQTGLSVTPGLWSSIQRALDGSEWFVLLASPEAARSPWVNREIEHWIATKPANRILPVVTDGEWQWDPAVGDLTADSTAVPDALRGVFGEEPLYLDLRWARDDGQLSLQHPRFRDAIAQLAAPMHGISLDELEGEDVRQHRRVRRVRRVAVAALALLTVVASLASVLAGHNADRATALAAEARRQEKSASQQRSNAELSLQEAQRQQGNARTQEERARAATTERVRQENRARKQQGLAERAATEAEKQQKNADRQQQLAKQAQTLAEEQRAVAREQSELAQESAGETSRQRRISERLQRLAADAAAAAETQKRLAEHQQWLAGEATAEARRQAAAAEQNEQKAKLAAEDARRQEENAAEQKQILLSRKLLNQARETINDDPVTALRLGLAAQKIHPGTTANGELAGLVTSSRLAGTAGDIISAANGPNDVIAVIGSDNKLSLRSVANRATPVQLASIEGESFRGEPVFSPDGKTLAVAQLWQGQPTLFDVSDPAHPKRLGTVPVLYARWLAFSPDGQTLAAATSDGKWTLWDLTDRASPVLLTTQTKGFADQGYRAPAAAPISFSPDSRTLVTAGPLGTVWDITDPRKPAEVGTLDGSWQTVAFSPTRPLLASSDANGNLALWRMDDRTKPQKFSTMSARSQKVTFSSDGLTLATSDNDGTARLWDMADDAPAHIVDVNDHSGNTTSVTFSPDGRTLTTATGRLSLWTIAAQGQPTILSRAASSATGQQLLAALTPDGQRLTTAERDGTATVWDVSKPASPVERATVRLDPNVVDAVTISPDGNTMAVLGWSVPDSGAALFDLTDPSKPTLLSVLTTFIDPTMTFSPDGRTLAVSKNFEVVLWDLSDRQNPVQLGIIPGTGQIDAIAFSPDSRTVAVARRPSIVTLWRVADRDSPVQLKGHSDAVLAMAFSPDGRTLATGSRDRTAALWNVADQTPLRRLTLLTGNGAPVRSVAFAPDGRTLATGTSVDTATLWDVTELSGPVRVATLRRGNHGSQSLLFHPDGRTLTTSGSLSGNTEMAIQWDYSALNDLRANPAAHACATTGGGFTEDEWAAHIPEVNYQPTCPR